MQTFSTFFNLFKRFLVAHEYKKQDFWLHMLVARFLVAHVGRKKGRPKRV